MLLNTDEIKKAISNGSLVQNLVDPDVQVQQCGVDLTIAKLFSLDGNGLLDFSNEKRQIPDYKEINPKNGKWQLQPGTYHAAMNETIKIPTNIAALLLPRSSALACGLEVQSALWDPGYEGRGFMHFSLQRKVELHKNARITQMIFFKLPETNSYKGIYKGEDVLTGKRG